MEKTVVAYVDGSYCKKQKAYGSGVVMLHEGKVIKKYSFKGDDASIVGMWNVAGEIKAAEQAMIWALRMGFDKLILHYDYEGIEKWCTGAWKAKKEGTQDYAYMYGKVKQGIEIEFVKVKAHSGDTYNDLADKLAKFALGIK